MFSSPQTRDFEEIFHLVKLSWVQTVLLYCRESVVFLPKIVIARMHTRTKHPLSPDAGTGLAKQSSWPAQLVLCGGPPIFCGRERLIARPHLGVARRLDAPLRTEKGEKRGWAQTHGLENPASICGFYLLAFFLPFSQLLSMLYRWRNDGDKKACPRRSHAQRTKINK